MRRHYYSYGTVSPDGRQGAAWSLGRRQYGRLHRSFCQLEAFLQAA